MSCRFIWIGKVEIIQYTFGFNLHRRLVEKNSKAVDFFLRHCTVDNYYGVVEITSFNQVILLQEFNFMKENKGTAGRETFLKFTNISHGSVLMSYNPGIKVDMNINHEIVVGIGHQFNAFCLIAVFNFFTY